MIILQLDAGRTRNGRPRRAFVIFDDLNGHVVDFVDAGCRGRSALRKRYGNRLEDEAVELGAIVTTPGEVRRFRDLADLCDDDAGFEEPHCPRCGQIKV